jgi:excisionase family DNA binding protein
MKKFCTVKQFSEEIGVGTTTIYQWLGQGVIPHWRVRHVIRIPLEEALQALENRGKKALQDA